MKLTDVVTRVNNSTRVSNFGDSDSTRVTFFTKWLGSCHNQCFETRVTVIFTKSQCPWWTNPVRLHTKKCAVFTSVMISICANFLFCLPSRALLCSEVGNWYFENNSGATPPVTEKQ